MRHALVAFVAGLAAVAVVRAGNSLQQPPVRGPAPKLVVMIVVDQMRADAVERFAGDWTGGLKRLVTEGARFTNAAYPYLTTVTCAGHATVATGALPSVHGIFQNAWWDRDAGKLVGCTEDSDVRNIGYGVSVSGGDSARRLKIDTFADLMRTTRSAHVVSLSLKDRSAIMLAGHGGDAVTWLSNNLDGWVTSSAFTTAPLPAVEAFTRANPIAADFGKAWTRLLPIDRYQTVDDEPSEAPPQKWTRTFPHPLSGGGQPDRDFLTQWETSPFADAYVGRFAAALVDAMRLGSHEGTDVLGIGFSAPDNIGHGFGPRSQEVQDAFARLDATLGILFQHLDAVVGRDQYVVALTADHGVTPIPEQLQREGQDAGRLSPQAIVDTIEGRLRPALGAGAHVARENGNDVYFTPEAAAALRTSAPLLEDVRTAIHALPGIGAVYTAEQVAKGSESSDTMLRAAALSYVPKESGDLILVPKPGWMFRSVGTTHATSSADDQRVPLLLAGRGIKPGRYTDAVTPADIAPTLAAICGISLPRGEGHVLTALK